VKIHFISFDVHCAFTEIAVVSGDGKLLKRERCATAIPPLVKFLQSVKGPRKLTFEEGPMAGWLYRHLHPYVDQLLVCEPRRNSLIAKDSDKDDPIDAEKLAQLYRGGYLKEVHHALDESQALFKQRVALYHDRVRHRVRTANRIMGEFRQQGVFVKEANFTDPEDRTTLLQRVSSQNSFVENRELMWEAYDLAARHVEQMRSYLVHDARQVEVIRRFQQVPGFGWVRAATFYAYVDTPWRFKSKSALWRYLGIGLERAHSGNGPVKVRVSQQANRLLRGIVVGAAKTIIDRRSDPFYAQYHHWLEEGISLRNARRNLAQSLAATLWGMWKNGSEFAPEQVASATREVGQLARLK
jgi:transposase